MTATTDLTGVTRQFRALSDENRLRIVDVLRGGEQCVCDLTAALDLGQSLLSFHVKTLKDAGLVTDRRDGRWAYYKLTRTQSVELWVGCVAGALREDEFVSLLSDVGFVDASIEPTRVYDLADARAFLTIAGLDADAVAHDVSERIMSAFVRAQKPEQ